MKPFAPILLALLIALAGLPAHAVLTTNWPFTTASQYAVSDTNTIEVADGVAKLKKQYRPAYHASFENYTNSDASLSNMAMGPNYSVGLRSVGAGSSISGRYVSPIIDGGSLNIWQGLKIRASNRNLGSNSIWETVPSSPGLVALYHFNGDWTNVISGSQGTPVSSPQFVNSAAFGSQSLYLRGGINGSGFTTANSNLLDGASAFTLSLWVNLSAYTEYGGLLNFRNPQIWGLWQRYTGAVEFWFYNNTYISSTNFLTLGQWCFVAATFNGGTCSLYLNGVLQSSGNAASSYAQQAVPFDVGFDRSQNSRYSKGNFDEVCIYNRALTAEEISGLYNRRSSIGLRIRSGVTPLLAGGFVGPDGTSGSYYIEDSQPLATVGGFNVGQRYIQFEALLRSDGFQSPFLEAVQVMGSGGVVHQDVLGDIATAVYDQNTTNVPARVGTPLVTLAQGIQGIVTNGTFTSRVFDAGSPVTWSYLSFDRGTELANNLYGAVGLWHMNNDWSDTVGGRSVVSGSGYTFTPVSKLGTYSAAFNGLNAYVNFGDFQTNLQSAELWLNTDAATSGILEFGASSPWLAVSNQVVTVSGWSNTPPVIYVNGTQGRQLLPGWNHIAVVFPTNIVSDALTLGLARGSYFSGSMDDFAVYRRALTLAEATEHFVAGGRVYAGQVNLQVRAGNSNPIQGAFSGNYKISSPLALSGQYFQYMATLNGDGQAGPALSSVAVTHSAGNFSDNTQSNLLAGTLDGTTVRLHGDEMFLRPLVSSGAVNLSPADTTSLLGLWHMDDSQWIMFSASVVDELGVHYGTPYTGASVVGNGAVGTRCGLFSGTGYISLSGIQLFANDFTVSAWFKTAAGGREAVMSSYLSGGAYYALEVNGDGFTTKTGTTTFVVSDGATTVTVPCARNDLNDGNWHHLSGVRNGRQAHLYLDGQLVGTAPLGAAFGAVDNTAQSMFIARHGNQSIYFSGNIDEVVIHGRALTSGEIGDLAARGVMTHNQGQFISPVINAGAVAYWDKLYWGSDAAYSRPLKPDTSSMAGLWHFESVSNNITADSSGSGNDASVTAGAGISSSGRFDNGVSLSAGQTVQVSDSPLLRVGAFSVEAWINPSNAPSLTVAQKGAGSPGFTLGTDSSGRPFLTVNGVTTTDVDILRARKWNHLCGTHDGQTARLYVNGLLKGAVAVSGSAQNTSPLVMGNGMVGVIDEAALYDRVLNTIEILNHYRAGVGTLKFQVRSFPTSTPQGDFVGPDGTTNTWFVDFDGSTLTGNAGIPVNQYAQYRALMASEDARFSPILDSIRVDYSFYPIENPWVVPADGFGAPFLGNLTAFSHILASTNSTAVHYQISGNNGTNWYAWIGGNWADVTAYSNPTSQWTFSNSPDVINANIGSFYTLLYQGLGGTFKFRAFLKSDSLQQVELDEVDLGYAKGRLLLTSPNGTEVSNNAWVVGVPYNITWSSSGSVTTTNITIELYDQSGSNLVRTIASGATNSGVYRSVINGSPGSTYRIRIRDASDPTIFDWSDGDFELVYNIHLSVPNGGEKWYVGDTNNVSWETPLTTEMSLWLSNDNGSNNWVEVARAPAIVGTNGFRWAIQTHEGMLPAMTAKMAVSTPDVQNPFQAPFYDLSDNSFVMAGAVVTYPNATTGVKIGDIINVQWASAAAGPNVKIELYDGAAWTNLVPSAPNVDGTNSLACRLVAPNPTEAALIRISSLSDGRIVAVSYPFLLADIRILSPKGGATGARDQWQISTTNMITWVSGGAGDQVNVDYSTDGLTWKSIAANYANTNSSGATVITNFAPPWIIQGPPSSNALVRVSSVTRSDLRATTEFFDIAGVQVVSPNGAEYWEFTGTNTIQWLAQAAGFNLGVGITYNGGATTNDYITLDPSLSIFSGNRTVIPGRLLRPSTLAKVRLVANDTVGNPIPMTDTSDAYFTIRGLSMFQPTTNAICTMGATVTDGLQWYSAATEDPTADLYYSKDGSNFTSLIVANTPNIDAGSSWNHINWAVSRSLEPSKTARVKVVAGSYQALSPVFTLRGIRITQPTAGQIFDLGSRQFVNWTAAGLSDSAYMSNVVSVAGQGGAYMTGGLPGNTFVRNAALTWNIDPDLDPSTNVVIKMIVTTPTNDTDIVMFSDPFTLRGVKILSPSTGTNWMIGTQRSIVFTAAGMAPGAVGDFYYSADGAATFDMGHPVAINVPMQSGLNSLVWNIENTSALTREPSTNAVLMLISGSVTNLSKPFRMGGVKVTAPKGTDIWAVSDLTNTIQWVGVDTQPSFSLFYTVYDAPQHSAVIASAVPGFSYDWAMTTNAIGSQVTITVTDGVTTNESPPFVIVPSPSIRIIRPASGEFWKVGDTNNVIQWVKGGNMSNDFTLGYSPFPFTVTNTIATGAFPLDSGIYSFVWGPIPNSLGQVRVVVQNNQNAGVRDSLDNFRIAPTFLITPFIGDLHALEPKDVSWTTLGSISGVDFYYSTDPLRATNSWTLINTSGPYTGVAHGQASSYLWNVPNIRSSTVWFRIQDHAYAGTMFDATKKGPYDDLGVFDVLYYTVVWRVYDAATSNELNDLSVTDSSGWSTSGLTSPISHDYPYGFWNTVWYRQYFNDRIVLNWSSKAVSTNIVYMSRTEASQAIHVMASFVYDPSNSVFKTVAWLERDSKIIPDPTECKVYIYDSNGNEAQVVTAPPPLATGTFWADVGSLLDKNQPYFAKVEIKYSGVTYTSGITFTLLTPSESAIAAVNAARDAILGGVSNVNDNVTSVGIAQQAFRMDVTNRLASLSNSTAQIRADVSGVSSNLSDLSSNALAQLGILTNSIGVIGPSGTNLVDQVRALTQEVDKRTAKIISRPTSVKLGGVFDVLYRSLPGSTATVTVMDSNGVQRASLAMTELSGGVYEKYLTASWGLGDYTVACSDGSGASDRMIIKVTAVEMDDLSWTLVNVSNQLAGVELSMATMSTSVSNVDNNVQNMVTNLTSLMTDVDQIYLTVSNMPGQMAYMTNVIDKLVVLTNITPAVSAMTNAVAQIVSLTNMSAQLASLSTLTNLTPQMASLTNSMWKLSQITNSINAMSAQMSYVTNVIDQIVVLTNINSSVAAMTGAVAQITVLTNMSTQLAFVTNVVSQMGVLTNLTPQMTSLTNSMAKLITITNSIAIMSDQMNYMTNVVSQVVMLTNINPAVVAMTNAVAQISGLTNMGAQLNYLTNAMGQVQGLTNLTSQMTSLSNLTASINGQTASLTNLVTKMASLTNLPPQIAFLTNNVAALAAQMNYLTNLTAQISTVTNLTDQMNYVTNVIDQIVALTNINPQIAILTNAVGSISGLTNMGSQLSYLTNAVWSLSGLTNVAPQIASLTNLTASIATQTASLTNLVTRMAGLTNLTPQVASLTNYMAQMMVLTNTPAQLSFLTNVMTQLSGMTNISAQVASMTNAIGQISGMTNLPSQMNYLTNIISQMTGITNIGPQVASMTNAIGQIAGMTNLPSQMNYMTNIVSQLTGITNIGAQVASMTNAIGQIAGLTNFTSQMDYMTNIMSQLTGITNIGPQVASMTNAIGQIAGMTNLPSQMNYLTNIISQLSGMTNVTAQIAGLTNLNAQMGYLTNLLAQVNGTTLGMTNSLDRLSTLTNMADQVEYLTNMMWQLSAITNIGPQVASMTNAIGQIAGMTNLPSQMNYLTNVISQLTGMTNISAQVASMTNAIGQIAGMTNLPSQMNYLTNVIDHLTGLTNISAQVASMTNAIGQIAGMTNLPSQMNYLTNVIDHLTGLTNISDQVASMTNSIGQIAGMTNLPSQMNYLTNIINQLSGMTNISDQVASMTNSIGLIAGMTNLPGQVASLTNLTTLGGLTNMAAQLVALSSGMSNIFTGVTNLTGQVNWTDISRLLNNSASLSNNMASLMGSLGGVNWSNITALGTMGASVSNISADVTSLRAAINWTNVMDVLHGVQAISNNMGSLSSSINSVNWTNVANLGTSMATVYSAVTNLQGTINWNDVLALGTAVGGVSNDVRTLYTTLSGIQWSNIASVATLGPDISTMYKAVTNLQGQSDWKAVTSLQSDLSTVAAVNSNIQTAIETKLGVASDSASTDTIFGRIAAIEKDVSGVGATAGQAAQRASGARSQANSAAGAAQRIRNAVATGQMPKVMDDLAVIRKALESALKQIKEVPGTMTTEDMVKTLNDAADTMKQAAKSRGVDLGMPDKGEKGSLLTDPKAVTDLMNKLAETKAMMEATRLLLDEAVNKPVVVDWLEGK